MLQEKPGGGGEEGLGAFDSTDLQAVFRGKLKNLEMYFTALGIAALTRLQAPNFETDH